MSLHFAIIAAGEGSRMVQEGVAVPKPLVDLDGRPMIRRLIDVMAAQDPASISVIVNEQMTQVAYYLRSLSATVPLRLVIRTTPGSLHSLAAVTEGLQGKVIATTVDTIFRPDEFAAYADSFARARDVDALMGVTDFIDDEKPLYVDTDLHMRVTAFTDTPPASGARYISGGIYGLDEAALSLARRCCDCGVTRMRDYQRSLLVAGLRVEACAMTKIIDVDHAADIEAARQLLSASNPTTQP